MVQYFTNNAFPCSVIHEASTINQNIIPFFIKSASQVINNETMIIFFTTTSNIKRDIALIYVKYLYSRIITNTTLDNMNSIVYTILINMRNAIKNSMTSVANIPNIASPTLTNDVVPKDNQKITPKIYNIIVPVVSNKTSNLISKKNTNQNTTIHVL